MADTQQQIPKPVRVLVETKSHLVPGGNYTEKHDGLNNLICQHVWQTQFDRKVFRARSENDILTEPGHVCYFIVDHDDEEYLLPVVLGPADDEEFSMPVPRPDDEIPVLFYYFDGESLLFQPHGPPATVPARLVTQWPFRRPVVRQLPPDDDDARRQKWMQPAELDEEDYREMIQWSARRGTGLSPDCMRHLKTHPSTAAWLEENLLPEQWGAVVARLHGYVKMWGAGQDPRVDPPVYDSEEVIPGQVLPSVANAPEGPVRVLVRTEMRLLPGANAVMIPGGIRKSPNERMNDTITRTLWGREWDPIRYRSRVHRDGDDVEGGNDDDEDSLGNGDNAGALKKPSPVCYWIVDSGDHLVVPPEDVPILFYEWDGFRLLLQSNPPSPSILELLRTRYPWDDPRSGASFGMPWLPTRNRIRNNLRRGFRVSPSHVRWLEDRPDEAEWIREQVTEEQWDRLVGEGYGLLDGNSLSDGEMTPEGSDVEDEGEDANSDDKRLGR